MPQPDVTVITPVHDTCDYLGPWFDSLLGQSLPRDRFEVIAVDDGSTDGSGRALDELARAHPELLQVVHLPPSGGPARPRNLALESARGRYVFFLDSDDRLGPEALERLTDRADRLDADVVLGRMAGVNGRRVPKDVFRHSVDRADPASSGILYALTPAKLFRRELIESNSIRFREELRIGSDHPFVVECYLRAGRVSVLADYTCYYLVAREGGGNISLGTSVTSSLRLPYMRASAEAARRVAGPGETLDALLKRILRIEFADLLGPGFTALAASAQHAEMDALRGWLDDWYRAELFDLLPSWVRWRIHCVQEGKRAELCALIATEKADDLGFRTGDSSAAQVQVSAGRAYADLPGFRDPAFGIPDGCYDVTGELSVEHRLTGVRLDRGGLTVAGSADIPRLPGRDTVVEVFARERGGAGRVALVPLRAEEQGRGAFRARWEGAALAPPGAWDLFAEVRVRGVRKEVRIGSSRAPGLILPSGCYWTKPYGNLSLRVVPLPPIPLRPRQEPPGITHWHLRRLRLGRVLEIGCGTGRNLLSCAPGSVGLERDPDALAAARARGLTVHTAEEFLASPAFAWQGFDSILVAHLLEHLSSADARTLLTRFLPYLRPDGRVVLVSPQEGGRADRRARVRFLGFPELRRQAEQSGLTVERAYSFPLPRRAGRRIPFTFNDSIQVARLPRQASGQVSAAPAGPPAADRSR